MCYVYNSEVRLLRADLQDEFQNKDLRPEGGSIKTQDSLIS